MAGTVRGGREPSRAPRSREPARRGTHPQRNGALGYLEGRIDLYQAEPGKTTDWLYVMSDRTGLLKIGMTTDLHRKRYVMGQQIPKRRRPVTLVHAVELEGAWLLERALHRKFAGRRVYDHGPTTEWFAITPAACTRAICGMLREGFE